MTITRCELVRVAGDLLMQFVHSPQLDEFLTLKAYDLVHYAELMKAQ